MCFVNFVMGLQIPTAAEVILPECSALIIPKISLFLNGEHHLWSTEVEKMWVFCGLQSTVGPWTTTRVLSITTRTEQKHLFVSLSNFFSNRTSTTTTKTKDASQESWCQEGRRQEGSYIFSFLWLHKHVSLPFCVLLCVVVWFTLAAVLCCFLFLSVCCFVFVVWFTLADVLCCAVLCCAVLCCAVLCLARLKGHRFQCHRLQPRCREQQEGWRQEVSVCLPFVGLSSLAPHPTNSSLSVSLSLSSLYLSISISLSLSLSLYLSLSLLLSCIFLCSLHAV